MNRVRVAFNRFLGQEGVAGLDPSEMDSIRKFHQSFGGYEATPLRVLNGLARELGVGKILVKDESRRFGLKAFKVLGATYGLARFLDSQRKSGLATNRLTFATATDGNHGRAVAWAATRLGHRAVIFVPSDMVSARRQAIAGEGAEVRVVEGHYDDAVALAEQESRRQGWQVLSDTAYPGYEEIPEWISRGYSTLFQEAQEQLVELQESVTHVFLQGGVGGMASAAVRVLSRLASRPRFICVEPLEADCLLHSIVSPGGTPSKSTGSIESIMSGLNCALPSVQAWPILRSTIDLFLAVDDGYAEEAVGRLYFPKDDDPPIIAGETGAAGLAGLLALLKEASVAQARRTLGLKTDSAVLLICTEGDTDPVGLEAIIDRYQEKRTSAMS